MRIADYLTPFTAPLLDDKQKQIKVPFIQKGLIESAK